jgi:hypothetical protein
VDGAAVEETHREVEMDYQAFFNRALKSKYSRYVGVTAFVIAMFLLWPNASVKGIQAYAALLGLRPIARRLIEHDRSAAHTSLSTKLSPFAVLLKLAIIPLADNTALNSISLVESLLRHAPSDQRRSRRRKVFSQFSIAANALALFGLGFTQLSSWIQVSLVSLAPLMSGWLTLSLPNAPSGLLLILSR